MDRKVIGRIADAAHISLTEDEIGRYGNDLDEILGLFRILDEAPDGDGIGMNPVEVADMMRDDVPCAFEDPYELTKDMRTYDGYVRGPRLL